jgi:hypothetical protein
MALDNFRRIDIRLDRANDFLMSNQFAKVGEYNGRDLVVQLTNAGVEEDQTGVSLNLGWYHEREKNRGLMAFEEVDVTKGIFKVNYPSEMLLEGTVIAVIQIVENEKITPSRNFRITVEKNPIDESTVVAENNFSLLQDALIMVNSWNGRIDVVEQDFKDRADAMEAIYPTRLTAAETSLAETATQIERIAIDVKSFGAVGDGTIDDTNSLRDALNYAKANNLRIICEPNKRYKVTSAIKINTDGVDGFEWDLQGSTIEISNNAYIVIGNDAPVAYKTTNVSTDLLRNGTKFTVLDATGVSVGDLVEVVSPVVWSGSTKLRQYYVVGDIDGNDIYVEGCIVGDISERQKTEAGVTGATTASFYKMFNHLVIKNGTFISPNRDNADQLLTIKLANNYLLENLSFGRTKRNGTYIMYSGIGIVRNCQFRDYGYVFADQGYVSLPSSPDGYSFGYGLITAQNYFTHVINCHSFSGWHGFDASVGQTVIIYEGCVSHKDAYGFSSHEGCWDHRVIGCQIIGGNGITCRAAELTVMNSHIKTSLGSAIAANVTQKLTIKNNVIDIKSPSNQGAAFTIATASPTYCYSLEESISTISNNSITGIGSNSSISTLGRIYFTGNELLTRVGTTGTISFNPVLVGQKKVVISENKFFGTGVQFTLEVQGESLHAKNNIHDGGVGTFNGSAFIYLPLPIDKVEIEDNNIKGLNYIVRANTTGTFVIYLIKGNITDKPNIAAGNNNLTIKNLIGNGATTSGYTLLATVTQSLNNFVLQ